MPALLAAGALCYSAILPGWLPSVDAKSLFSKPEQTPAAKPADKHYQSQGDADTPHEPVARRDQPEAKAATEKQLSPQVHPPAVRTSSMTMVDLQDAPGVAQTNAIASKASLQSKQTGQTQDVRVLPPSLTKTLPKQLQSMPILGGDVAALKASGLMQPVQAMVKSSQASSVTTAPVTTAPVSTAPAAGQTHSANATPRPEATPAQPTGSPSGMIDIPQYFGYSASYAPAGYASYVLQPHSASVAGMRPAAPMAPEFQPHGAPGGKSLPFYELETLRQETQGHYAAEPAYPGYYPAVATDLTGFPMTNGFQPAPYYGNMPIEQPRAMAPLPRYAGGAPPISFSVATTGEVKTALSASNASQTNPEAKLLAPVQQALAHFQANQPQQALAAMKQAVALAPDNPLVWAAMAELCLSLNQPQASVEAYAKAYQLQPKDYATTYAQALLQWPDASVRLQRLGGLALAHPKEATIQALVGTEALAQAQPQQALTYLQQAVELDSTLTSAWYNLGLAYEQLGRYAQAQAAYTQVLTLESTADDARVALARIQSNVAQAVPSVVKP
ncbi:MAG: tetratricopeptide repeat protein [Candidatus Melainabacteria bacterium]|nr:tetratricopeptide repeat protein [Candidatus Melainabacteria bacterium]